PPPPHVGGLMVLRSPDRNHQAAHVQPSARLHPQPPRAATPGARRRCCDRRMLNLPTVDRAQVLAQRQAALLSYAQTLEEGLTRGDVRHLVETGRWRRETPGVYRTPVVPREDPYDMARYRAAWTGLLAVPGGAATGMAAVAL